MYISFTVSNVKSNLLLDIAQGHSTVPGTCLLYSGGRLDSAQRSILALFAVDTFEGDTWGQLEEHLQWDPIYPFPQYLGYLSYEMGARACRDKEVPCTRSSFPLYQFYRHAVIVVCDHASKTAEVHCLAAADNPYVQRLIREKDLSILIRKDEKVCVTDLRTWSSSEDLTSYCKRVEQVKEHIRAGDIYQANFSQSFNIDGEVDPFTVFRGLAEKNPAPFSAFLCLQNGALVSSSPERLLKKEGCFLESRPIKGTIPRGKTEEEDKKNRQELLASEKDRAELLMITDLMRNDLGRLARIGSVKTEKIWHCEAYTNVFHLISILTAETDEPSPIETLRTVFPGGSITGCPKLRAMEIIHEMEQRPRDIYTGSIGYFSGNGDFDFNIAIRTLMIQEGTINVQLGGAIVIDSDPKAEYEETLHKGASIFEVLRSL